MKPFNPDPASAMFDTYFGPMECANTAAADEKTRTDRDATPEELAELEERVIERAKQIADVDFIRDVVADIHDPFWEVMGDESFNEVSDDSMRYCGRKIFRAIRDRAIAVARKELVA